jgi:DNA-binding MarR family transcriptional regulator
MDGMDSSTRIGTISQRPSAEPPSGDPDFELIELLFFAYRDFVGEADRVLSRYDFGRAHHRVLHFVNRNPGLTIAGLLDILQITKQSLARVLKDLIESGHIDSRAGDADRRQRRLACTPAGQQLAEELAALQSARIGRALAGLQSGGREVAEGFLIGLIEPRLRREVLGVVRRTDGP